MPLSRAEGWEAVTGDWDAPLWGSPTSLVWMKHWGLTGRWAESRNLRGEACCCPRKLLLVSAGHVCSVPHLRRTPHAPATHVSPPPPFSLSRDHIQTPSSPSGPLGPVALCVPRRSLPCSPHGIRNLQRERLAIYGCPTGPRARRLLSWALHPSVLAPEPPPHAAGTPLYMFFSVTPEVQPVSPWVLTEPLEGLHLLLLVRNWGPCLLGGAAGEFREAGARCELPWVRQGRTRMGGSCDPRGGGRG